MAFKFFSDLAGTLLSTFRIGLNGVLSSSGVTAARTWTFPDESGHIALKNIIVNQALHGFSVGQPVYYTGTAYALAKADNANTLGLFIVDSVIDANNFTLSMSDRITGLSGLTAGHYHYVSATTAGTLTTIEPNSGLYSNPILFADSSTTGFILPFRPSISGSATQTDGWDDILPVAFEADITGGWQHTVITGSRKALTATGASTTVSTVHFKYHIPHDVSLNQVAGEIYIHPHLEFINTAAGNIRLTAFISAALRDGPTSTEFTLTWTIAPSSYTPFTHYVTPFEQVLPAGLLPYLVPDAIWTVRLVRNAGDAADTYTSVVAIHTMDLHVRFDGKPTTSKDVGTGWVKIP